MKKQAFPYILIILLLLFNSVPESSHATPFTFSTGTPLYGQETSTWCGAASGQMILSQGGVTKTQTQVWNQNQINKKDNGFYTDPDGLALTLNDFDLKNQWGVISGGSGTQDAIIESLMEFMEIYSRPVALLVSAGNHWVVWNGFTSDIDPLKGDATLQQAIINDPWPVNIGNVSTLNSAAFEALFSLNTFGTLYKDDYVAVAPVPEPSAYVLLGTGLAFLAAFGLRRRGKEN